MGRFQGDFTTVETFFFFLGFDLEASFANGENVAGVRRTFISPVNRNFEE